MKQFLKDIAMALWATCIFLVLFELMIDYCPNEFSEKYKQWYDRRDSITLLMTGNSHVQLNIDANVFGANACNMAIGGSDIVFAQQMIEAYVPHMGSLETIIMNFDYVEIGDANKGDSDDGINKWLKLLRFIQNRYLHINREDLHYRYSLLCGQFHYSWWTDKHLTDLHVAAIDEYNPNEMNPEMKQFPREVFDSIVKSLSAIGKIAKDKGVRLIVVTAPFHPIIRNRLNRQSVDLLNRTLDSISQEYSLEYKNYLEDSMFSSEDLYVDTHHLNRRGAKLFAERIKNDFNLE